MGLFKGMKQSEESAKKKEAKERTEDVLDIVQEIFRLVAEEKPPVGVLSNANHDYYDKLGEKVIEFMLSKKMKYSNRHFVFQLALQPFEQLRDRVANSLGTTFEKMVDRAVGKDSLEVTLEDMDNIIKAQAEKK